MSVNRCSAQQCIEAKRIYRLDEEIDWIACDGCNEWYHADCLGIKLEPYKHLDFFCPACISNVPINLTKVKVNNWINPMCEISKYSGRIFV